MLESRSLWRLIEARAQRTPSDCLAVDSADREISFREYESRVLRTARGLARIGVRSGQTVSWMLPTRIEALILIGALSRLGAIQNPILPIYREREVRFITKQCRPSLLVTPSEWRGFDFAKMAEAIAAEDDRLTTLVVDRDLPESEDGELPPPNRVIDDPSLEPIRWIFYTSGTTADPKGVQHTDASLHAAATGMSRALDLQASDRVAFVFPVTHVGGINWLQAGLAHGCTQILIENFAEAETIPTLRKRGVTLAGAGTIFHEAYLAAQRRLAEAELASPARTGSLFPKVRAFPGGGAPKPPQLHLDLIDEIGGVGICSGYGSTEAPILTMSRVDDPSEKLARTEGRPSLPNVDLRVVRTDDQLAAPGEEGEIRARGPQLFRGYVDSALDRDAFDDEGYFRTGDLGRIDREGYVVITGRLKDIIIRKGENIPAKEVEDLLYTHPKVADVAVIGLPDSEMGERCCAIVSCHDEKDPIDAEEMKEFLLGQQLMIQRVPEQLEIVERIPRNATGKILKHELRARFGS
jgi:acyl-CoA synthetase (AMP-forming)/AMP-acid ligase II